MRLVAYERVSSPGQVEDGFGLAVQRSQISRWAASTGHRIVRHFADEGVSGAVEFEARKGLTAALEAVREGRAVGLVVAKLDRLARSLTVQEAALAHIWRVGGMVFAVDHGEVQRNDPDDPMRTAMRQMVGVFSELDRAMIVKRLRDGRHHKARGGGYSGGAPPYGYRADSGRLVLDPGEQATLKRITELHKDGCSFREIARTLDQEKRPPRRGSSWHPYALARVVGTRGGR